MDFQYLYRTLAPDLTIIEKKLSEVLYTESPLLRESSLHYLKAGGKRIRPILVLLSAKFGNDGDGRVIDTAVAMELIHMASLIHDDIIDNAETRRGKPTVKAKWDNKIAVYTGDFILARSLELITKIPDVTAHRILSKTMVELSLGEIEQIRDRFNFQQTVTAYLRRIKRKTALLIAACCQLGAIAAGCERKIHQQLYWFGYFAGMGFQITDDILDFTGTPEELGKPAGEDLYSGTITLPSLFALRNPDLRQEILQVQEGMDPEHFQKILADIRKSDAIGCARKVADWYLEKSLSVLSRLPDNEIKPMLETVVHFIGRRNH
jgi:Polyprenyl synthetase.